MGLERFRENPFGSRSVQEGKIYPSNLNPEGKIFAETPSRPTPPELPEEIQKRLEALAKRTEKRIRNSHGRPKPNEPKPTRKFFVDDYTGNFAQQMIITNHAEQALRIANLDGSVLLTSMSPSRQRSIDANPDGSVTSKRNLIFGEKINQDDQENPLRRVAATPNGWSIEINDTRITDELMERNLTKPELQKQFTDRFNSVLRGAIMECVWREKLTDEKDKDATSKKVRASLLPPIISITGRLIAGIKLNTIDHIILVAVSAPLTYAVINILNLSERKIDHLWENFMPEVEIDKVARTYAYLSLKGRDLVREK